MLNYKVNIIGVERRKKLIIKLCNKLNLTNENVIYDADQNGPLFSVIKALEANKKRVAYTVLLQDDAWPCDDFYNICEMIICAHPNSIIGLFPFDFIDDEIVPIETSISPYYDVGIFSGVGVIFPNKYSEKFIEFAKFSPYPREDDRTMAAFAKINNIEILQTVPAVVQHIGDESILFKDGIIRRSNYFNIDMDVDWNSSQINHLKYHSSLERKIAEKVEWSKQYIKNLVKERSQNNDK